MKKIRVPVCKSEACNDLPYPAYMTAQAAGMDLYASVEQEEILPPGGRVRIPTGIFIALPSGVEAQIRARSGLAFKHGIGLVNGPGTIDADYRGEIGVLLVNHGSDPFPIHRGDRIAQMVIAPVLQAEWEAVKTLPESERSDGGFGHTGHAAESPMRIPIKKEEIEEKAKKIGWIFLDVDGVLTDGRITYDSRGDELKTFYARDGHGIKLAQRVGIRFALITGRESRIVNRRAAELGIREVHQGSLRKLDAYHEITGRLKLSDEEISYVGDDLIDLPVMRRVGLSAAVADADPETRDQADLILTQPGGRGAVREFIELILKARNKWVEATKRYYP
ncbi:MAG: dUTP diphosphatase [Deltaproteobacteria bacterium]|nr:dUTP diphosphatase [Deltaproteobacteria bacterium]